MGLGILVSGEHLGEYGINRLTDVYQASQKSKFGECDIWFNRLIEKDPSIISTNYKIFTDKLNSDYDKNLINEELYNEISFCLDELYDINSYIFVANDKDKSKIWRQAHITWAKERMNKEFVDSTLFVPYIPYWLLKEKK